MTHSLFRLSFVSPSKTIVPYSVAESGCLVRFANKNTLFTNGNGTETEKKRIRSPLYFNELNATAIEYIYLCSDLNVVPRFTQYVLRENHIVAQKQLASLTCTKTCVCYAYTSVKKPAARPVRVTRIVVVVVITSSSYYRSRSDHVLRVTYSTRRVTFSPTRVTTIDRTRRGGTHTQTSFGNDVVTITHHGIPPTWRCVPWSGNSDRYWMFTAGKRLNRTKSFWSLLHPRLGGRYVRRAHC